MYVGRFAPSPTGPLHAGSLVAALASWLDARAHHGRWLVRIEDVDSPRCIPEADRLILSQLATCGLHPDEPPVRQSERNALYQAALDRLVDESLAYPCHCSRKDIASALAAQGMVRERGFELAYPGTCRPERAPLPTPPGQRAAAWRLHTGHAAARSPQGPLIAWQDRRLGTQSQMVEACVGDFVLKRADGLWAYQLAVVVDDAAQGITHVVRGEDLADNTPRQILLQRALGLSTPVYMHTPLVLASDGEKLSKQNGAQPLDLTDPLNTLSRAALHLNLSPATPNDTVPSLLTRWVQQWAANL